MVLDRRCGRTRITYKFVVLTIAMSLLVSGLFVLFIYLSSARGGQNDRLAHSRAELVRHHFGSGNVTGNYSSNVTCPKFHFLCKSSEICLELERRCDGLVDCPKAEDELDCACAFRMPPSKFCDKYPDCFDESDESFCSYCPEGYFNCGDGKCIPRKLVCDSRVDCDNFMDENFCFRLSPDATFSEASRRTDPVDSTNVAKNLTKTGYLMRNKNGAWYPVCANPADPLQDALASFACVSITSNPLASSTHHQRKFGTTIYASDYIYHNRGRFVLWRGGCLGNSGLFVACDDVRCGFNPRHLLPKKRNRGRIVGGEVSEPGAWPWHGAVYKDGSYACGATLISDRWLISAAHCFIGYRRAYYEVQLGMLRRKSFTPHQKTYRLDRVVPHHRFSVVTLEFDIAMLRLSEPVTYDFWVRPICLPEAGRKRRRGMIGEEWPGAYCTAIGWGDTGETADDSEDLLEVHVPLRESCKRDSQRWLCAGYLEGGRDACQGDSGGPLMCLREDGISWYIAGVISAGNGCARPNTPGMYTRVVHFLDWIQKTMINHRHQGGGKSEHQPLSTCPGWKCAAVGGGYCLKAERVCDGHVDCYDAQDEANCLPGIVNNVSGQPPV